MWRSEQASAATGTSVAVEALTSDIATLHQATNISKIGGRKRLSSLECGSQAPTVGK